MISNVRCYDYQCYDLSHITRAWYVAAFEVGRADDDDDDDDDALDERAVTEEDDGGSVTSAISASSARNSRSSALTYGRGSAVVVKDD
jgi:hypothetical protein